MAKKRRGEQPGGIVTATAESVLEAAERLVAGGLVAFPTETVYGLGGDATNDRVVAAIFAAKDRPDFNPLIVHLPRLEAARAIVRIDARAEAVAARFWPGGLTLVLPRAEGSPVSLLASAGLPTIAVRVPAHPVAHALLNAAGRPIAAPSANRSGSVSPTEAAHVAESLGLGVAMILDGRRCPVGIESTVLDLTTDRPVLLRPGAIPEEALVDVVGPIGRVEAGDAVRSPGQLASHYAPDRPLRLSVDGPRPNEALLAFGPDVPPGFAAVENLSPSGDLNEAAANLFAMLRSLDRPEHSGIAAMTVPETGLGRAINDRLLRAATAA